MNRPTAHYKSTLYRRSVGKFAGLCAYPLASIPKTRFYMKKHIIAMCFPFGTPIGNRTLVSAVRGRRLEPLDHEGKSLLLCDNIIFYRLMQAKCLHFLPFTRKNKSACKEFWIKRLKPKSAEESQHTEQSEYRKHKRHKIHISPLFYNIWGYYCLLAPFHSTIYELKKICSILRYAVISR